MKQILLTTLFILLLPVWAWASDAHYADLSDAGSSNIGTFAEPFNSMWTINAHAFITGDDLYFKAGTDEIPSTYLNIDWIGTSGDRVIIGAYDGDVDFDITGSAKPILDGNFTIPDQYYGLIDIYKSSGGLVSIYVTIQDIQINNSKGHGIAIRGTWASPSGNGSENIVIEDCYVYRPWGSGISLSRGNNVQVNGCEVEEAGYNRTGSGYGPQAGIASNGSQATNLTVYNCVVHGCNGEGIGFYNYAPGGIAQHNIVYDCKTVGIYPAGSHDSIVYDNIVYQSTNYSTLFPAAGNMVGIWITIEPGLTEEAYGHIIAGNYVGGPCSYGIYLNQNITITAAALHDNYVYNNTVVDCGYNIGFNNYNISGGTPWSDNYVYNNLSYQTEVGVSGYHANVGSPTGVTFSNNYINADGDWSSYLMGVNLVQLPASDDPIIKSAGWDAITAGAITFTNYLIGYFGLVSTSACIDAACSLTHPVSSGSESTEVTVTDPLWFYGDEDITIDTDKVTILSITGSVLTIDEVITFGIGDPIYYRNFSGSAPDIGADEYIRKGVIIVN